MWKVLLFWMSVSVSGWTAASSDTATTYMEAIKACTVEIPVKLEDLEKLKNRQVPESTPVKCLLACMFRKAGFIDDEGKFSPENVLKRTQTIYPGDAAKLEQTQKYIDMCKKVNEAAVNDGVAGCERAALLFQCTTDYKSEIDFTK